MAGDADPDTNADASAADEAGGDTTVVGHAAGGGDANIDADAVGHAGDVNTDVDADADADGTAAGADADAEVDVEVDADVEAAIEAGIDGAGAGNGGDGTDGSGGRRGGRCGTGGTGSGGGGVDVMRSPRQLVSKRVRRVLSPHARRTLHAVGRARDARRLLANRSRAHAGSAHAAAAVHLRICRAGSRRPDRQRVHRVRRAAVHPAAGERTPAARTAFGERTPTVRSALLRACDVACRLRRATSSG